MTATTTQTTTEAATVLVSTRAMLQRINRALAPDRQMLRKTRGGAGNRSYRDLGDYYIVDLNRNAIVRGHVDLEQLGRELKVLAGWERFGDA